MPDFSSKYEFLCLSVSEIIPISVPEFKFVSEIIPLFCVNA